MLTLFITFPRPDGVVPIPVEVMPLDVEGEHFFFGDFDVFGIFSLVDFRADAKPGFRRGGGDEADDGRQTGQRLTAPVHADVGE